MKATSRISIGSTRQPRAIVAETVEVTAAETVEVTGEDVAAVVRAQVADAIAVVEVEEGTGGTVAMAATAADGTELEFHGRDREGREQSRPFHLWWERRQWRNVCAKSPSSDLKLQMWYERLKRANSSSCSSAESPSGEPPMSPVGGGRCTLARLPG